MGSQSSDEDSQKPLIIEGEKQEEEEQEWSEISLRQNNKRRRWGFWSLLPWALCAFFAATTLALSLKLYTLDVARNDSNGEVAESGKESVTENENGIGVGNTYEVGFDTDFVPAPSSPAIEIKMVQKQFTNSLRWNATNGRLYNERLGANETMYIGASQEVVDASWHDLLFQQYVAISKDEIPQLDQVDQEALADEEQSYLELSVFHYLHCLNAIRETLDKKGYGNEAAKKREEVVSDDDKVHMDHCIDQIRQALECGADLTPVPMLPIKGHPGRLWIGNGETHTCRDFGAIRNWVSERSKITPALGT